MNFFEGELRQMFGNAESISDAKFVGRTMLGKLDDDLQDHNAPDLIFEVYPYHLGGDEDQHQDQAHHKPVGQQYRRRGGFLGDADKMIAEAPEDVAQIAAKQGPQGSQLGR